MKKTRKLERKKSANLALYRNMFFLEEEARTVLQFEQKIALKVQLLEGHKN